MASSSKSRNAGRPRTKKSAEPNDYGRALERARLAVPGLSQEDLGDLIGITGDSVSNYESGVSFPKRPIAEKLDKKLKARPSTLPDWDKVNEQRGIEKKRRRLSKTQDAKPAPTPSQTLEQDSWILVLTSEEEELIKKLRSVQDEVDRKALHDYLSLHSYHRELIRGAMGLIESVNVPEGKVLTFVPKLIKKRANG